MQAPQLTAGLASLAKANNTSEWAAQLASFALADLQAHGVRFWLRITDVSSDSALHSSTSPSPTSINTSLISPDVSDSTHTASIKQASNWQLLHELGHGMTLTSQSFDPQAQQTHPLISHLVFGKGALECVGACASALERWQELRPLLELALEGVQARELSQGAGRTAETVEALVRRLGGSLDLADVLSKTAQSVALALGFERAIVTLFNEVGEDVAHSSQSYAYGFVDGFSEGIQVGPMTLEKLVSRGEAIGFERGRDAGSPLAQALAELNPQVAVLAPLTARRQTLGLLYVDTQQAGTSLSEPDKQLVLALAEQASLAIDNARLYGLEIRKRQGAEALREAGVALASSLRLSDTFAAVLRWASELFSSDAVALYELQNDQRSLRISSALGLPSEYLLRAKAKLGVGVSGQAVALQQAAYVHDVLASNYSGGSRYARKLIAQGKYPYRGILSLPLARRVDSTRKTAHSHVAALTLYWRQPVLLNADMLNLAGIFAAQASLSLENARLYEDESRREKESAVLLSLATLLDNDPNHELSQEAMDTVLEQIVTALNGWRGLLLLTEPVLPHGPVFEDGQQVFSYQLPQLSEAELASLQQQLGRGPRPLTGRLALREAGSAMLVPLRTSHAKKPSRAGHSSQSDQHLGFFYVDDPRRDLPPDILLELAKKIAEQLSQSLLKRRLHLALKHQEARYRQLAHSAHDLILSSDASGKITYANPAAIRFFEQVLAVSPLGQDLSKLSGPHTQSAWQAALAEVLGQLQSLPQMIEITLGQAAEYRLEVRLSTLEVGSESGVLLVARDLSELAELAAEIQQRGQDLAAATHRQSELRSFLALFTQAQEEERRRISRELHDDTAQVLVAIGRRISRLARDLSDEQGERAEDIRQDLDLALASVRRFARNLRPSVLDDLGLLPALEWLCQQASTPSRLEVSGNERRLSASVELNIFRLCQEALGNVDKHAEASSAAIRLSFEQNSVQASIMDDGKGFSQQQAEAQAKAGHLGLVGLRERVALLGGRLEVTSVEGEGARVWFELEC